MLQVYHSKFRSMKERDLEFRLDKLKLDPNSLVLQSDGLKVVFASPEDFYSLKEYIQDYKERHLLKSSSTKSSKLKAPMSASQPASSSSSNKQPNIKPSPSHQRYVSPNKSVSIVRNASDKKGSETKDSNPMKLFASPNKSRDTVTTRSLGVTPHRHFSPEAYRKNFAEVKDVTETVKQMKQRSFTPYEGSKSNDDSMAMDISSPISTPIISRKIAVPVAVESTDSIPEVEKSSPIPTAKTFGRKTLWSSLISGEPATRINPESSFYAATKPEMTPPIVSPVKMQEIPLVETAHSGLVTKKRKAPMTFYDIFDKGAAKQPKSVETNSTTSNTVLPTNSRSLLSPSKGWDNEDDDDDWITNSAPISAEALKGTKKLTTFFSTGSSSLPSTVKSLITTSTFPSLMTPSYVRTVFKGGIRNLGNSCYISTMMQCLFCLYELMNDVNSPFWSNILENQLEIDVTLSRSVEERLLIERLLLYNANSCLSEFIALIRQKNSYDQENLNKPVYIRSPISTLQGSKDIFDLSNLKRTMGKLAPQFNNFNQQDGQEFLMSFINQLEEEMSIRLQFFLSQLSLKVSGLSAQASHGSIVQNENSKANVSIINQSPVKMPKDSFTSPVSISNLPKTVQKEGQFVQSHLSNDESKEFTLWKDPKFVKTVAEGIIPSHYYLDNLVEIHMRCMACECEFPPKYEHYRDFSLDLDAIPSEEILTDNKEKQDVDAMEMDKDQIVGDNHNTEKEKEEKVEFSLERLLNNFFQDEICDWNCSHCHQSSKVRIRRKIVYLSKIVIIHLKRFHYSAEKNALTKIGLKVPFQLSYDFTRYSTRPTSSHTSSVDCSTMDTKYHALWEKSATNLQQSKENSITSYMKEVLSVYEDLQSVHSPENISAGFNSMMYDVFGIVRHLGKDLMGGHYICDVANPLPRVYNKTIVDETTQQEVKWIRYNDAIADPILEDKVLEETQTPYMFVLHRR